MYSSTCCTCQRKFGTNVTRPSATTGLPFDVLVNLSGVAVRSAKSKAEVLQALRPPHGRRSANFTVAIMAGPLSDSLKQSGSRYVCSSTAGKSTGAPSRARLKATPRLPPMQRGETGPPTKVQHLSQNDSLSLCNLNLWGLCSSGPAIHLPVTTRVSRKLSSRLQSRHPSVSGVARAGDDPAAKETGCCESPAGALCTH